MLGIDVCGFIDAELVFNCIGFSVNKPFDLLSYIGPESLDDTCFLFDSRFLLSTLRSFNQKACVLNQMHCNCVMAKYFTVKLYANRGNAGKAKG